MLGGVREQPFDVYLTDIKFEKGHRPSDWSAAPEDVMDSVQDYVRTHYVAKTGDTMTGELTLSATQPMLRLQRPSGSGFYLGFPTTTSNTAVWYAQNQGTGLFLLGDRVMANKELYVSTHQVYHKGNVLPARQVNLRSNMAGGSVSYQDARPSELSEESVMGLSTKALLNGSGNGWMMINKSWSEASGSYAINRIGIAAGRIMVQQAKNMSEWAEPFEVLTDSIFKVGTLAQENLNDVMRVGLYRQSLNRNATTANNYPVNQAGTLRVEPSAYEVYDIPK